MINFFRKKRKKLADDNQAYKYARYAVGEILLVVIGILIALQINTWNENRKQELQFKVNLEQLNTSITYDTQKFEDHINLIDYQIMVMDSILINLDIILTFENYLMRPGTENINEIPIILDFLTHDYSNSIISDTEYYTEKLSNNSNNKSHIEIFKYIINYVNDNKRDNPFKDYLHPLYSEYNIASPKRDLNHIQHNFEIIDSLYYKKTDILNAIKLINSNKFKTALKNTRNDKVIYRIILSNRLSNAKSILRIIKNYYPKVKVIYQDVGIIGTSLDGFDDVGGKSTPMLLTDIENDIWEIDLYLKIGRVKFRCRDSWAQNWGNDDFPIGIGILDGADIGVNEAGNYHIIFKPITGEYEFKKLIDD